MDMQLAILYKVFKFSLRVFIWIVPAMLVMNVLLELGALRKVIAPIGRFFTRFAGLPPEIAAAFISGFGSGYAGASMLVNFQEKRLLSRRQVFLGALVLSIPTHVREMFSYYLPMVFPLLGALLGAFYMLVHTLTVIVKFLIVMILGKHTSDDNVVLGETATAEGSAGKKSLREVLRHSLNSCVRPLKRMAITIPLTALIIYELTGCGFFDNLPLNPEKLGLPPCSTVCLVSYMANSMVGLSALAACYQGGDLTLIQTVKTMLWGNLLAGPIFLIRFSGTYYIGIYGPVLGTKIGFTSFAINSVVYAACLLIAAQFG
ncbi:MAG: Nucleoside recognition [Firmicutes bacterium ADurb.Bin373]|nr:MAG: Nucleoside recognition [Firmicutes bacterium ADurb.Bin373]